MINVKIIDHKEQRYDTCGDWQFDADGTLNITVSRMPDTKYMQLIAIHEIIEAILCKFFRISEEDVDKWDLDHPNHKEPGRLKNCPYGKQHMIATIIEQYIGSIMLIDWQEYEKAVEGLVYPEKTK